MHYTYNKNAEDFYIVTCNGEFIGYFTKDQLTEFADSNSEHEIMVFKYDYTIKPTDEYDIDDEEY